MPRALTPPYNFTLDPIYLAIPGQPITAAQFNTPMQDIQSTFNTVQPINYGGTGAATAAAALVALGGISGAALAYTLATGTNTIVVSPSVALTSLATGTFSSFTAANDISGTSTLNVSGLGNKALRKIVGGADVDVATGDVVAKGRYSVVYDAAAASAAGAWVLINPALNLIILASTFAKLAGNQTLTGGFSVTPPSLGNMTNFTVNPALGNLQYGTNHAAVTITAPASDCAVTLLITNDGTAGAITLSGFTVGPNTGDAYATTNTSKFLLQVIRINGVSTYAWKALQ